VQAIPSPCGEVDLTKYIGPEGGGLFNHILYAVSRRSSEERKELRIGDLIKTAEERRWFDMPL
jgi:hypothetical protein